MLETEDLEIIVEKIEARSRHLARIEGIEQQYTHTGDTNKVKLLIEQVAKIEEELREYGLMIDTVGRTNS